MKSEQKAVSENYEEKQLERFAIELPPRRVVCFNHKQPFMLQFPLGWQNFVHFVVDKLSENEQFILDVKEDSIEACQDLLDTRPACCWLQPEILLQSYHYARNEVARIEQKELFSRGRCDRCGGLSVGTPANIFDSLGNPFRFRFFCLKCCSENGFYKPLR